MITVGELKELVELVGVAVQAILRISAIIWGCLKNHPDADKDELDRMLEYKEEGGGKDGEV